MPDADAYQKPSLIVWPKWRTHWWSTRCRVRVRSPFLIRNRNACAPGHVRFGPMSGPRRAWMP